MFFRLLCILYLLGVSSSIVIGSQAIDITFIFTGEKGVDMLTRGENVKERFFNDRLNEARREYAPVLDVAYRDWLWGLYEVERAFFKGAASDFRLATDGIMRRKEILARLLGRGGRSYSQNMIFLEYSLVRMMQDKDGNICRQNTVDMELVQKLLAAEDFDLHAQTGFYSQFAYSFRNMLLLALGIEAYKKTNGMLPPRLEDMSLSGEYQSDAFGRTISYTVKDGNWMLYSSGSKQIANWMPFDIYEPNVLSISHNGYASARGLWFSATFDQKRKKWFEEGDLYKGTPYECKLPRGWK